MFDKAMCYMEEEAVSGIEKWQMCSRSVQVHSISVRIKYQQAI